MESMPIWLQYVMRTISPTPHFVSFAQAVLFRGADLTLVWRPLVAMLIIGSVYFCFRHEPLSARHFRELTAMPQQRQPNNGKMKRKLYEKELRKLQVELCHVQEWVKAKGPRVIVVFEGRDAAGKGGTIKAITEKVSPRMFQGRRVAGAFRS